MELIYFLLNKLQNSRTNYNVSRFFLTTAYHGEELLDWSNRALLLEKLRAVADKVI